MIAWAYVHSAGISLRCFLYDGQGSIRQKTTLTGAILTPHYNFDAYGNITNQVTPTRELLYAGEMWDPVLEMYYLRARHYSPATGRFNRTDPSVATLRDPQALHRYLYAHCNPINGIDPTGLFTLSEITVSVKVYVSGMAVRVSTAFAAGGTAVGRLWNAIGVKTNEFARQVFGLFPTLEVRPARYVGTRIIDFGLKCGPRLAQLEAKYSIPRAAGDALNRLAGQINAMVTCGQGQAVVWTLREPSAAELLRVQHEVGPDVFRQVQFVHGVEGLYNWIVIFFGF